MSAQPATQSPQTVDVVALMEQAQFRGVPLLVSVLTVLAMVFDGFDIQIIAFAAPALLEEFGLTRPQLGPLLAAGLAGMALGGFALGALGDRRGRRFALTLSLAIIAVTSLGAAFAQSATELAVWRFLTGIGLGGVVPNCTTLMREFAPLSVRNVVVALTVVGVPIGGVLGAEIAAQIIPAYGWRTLFLVGAALPAVLAVVIWLTMPESLCYLARRGDQPQRVAALLGRISGRSDLHTGMSFVVREPQPSAGRAGVAAVFSTAFRRDTLLLWVAFITNIFAVYAFFSWLPTVLSAVDLPIAVALRGSLIFNLGGVAGAIVLAMCISRYGSAAVLRATGAGAIAATLAMAFVEVGPPSIDAALPRGVATLWVLMALAGAFISGMQVGLYAVAAHVYPTEIRSTGVGWASSIARIGGILSSFGGGYLLVLGEGIAPFFVAVAIVLVPTLLGVWFLQRQIPPLTEPRRADRSAA